jgi:hypothetical protein
MLRHKRPPAKWQVDLPFRQMADFIETLIAER